MTKKRTEIHMFKVEAGASTIHVRVEATEYSHIASMGATSSRASAEDLFLLVEQLTKKTEYKIEQHEQREKESNSIW